MKCNASKTSEGNLNKSLPCNEECARLERNRKLALALNIDQTTHVEGGDHIPYSKETLSLFSANPQWAQTQEREFRVFAAADDKKRFRFKPMPAQQRAFLHSLAEDFGLDSESMDPEPHRHVAVFKTPRFVTAPSKSLAECVRIRISQRATAGKGVASGNTSDGESSKKPVKANDVGEPYNSFVIGNPRFGLTVEEVRAEVQTAVPSAASLQLDIEFLPSEEVVLKALNHSLNQHDLEQMLKNLAPAMKNAIAGKAIGKLQLCHTDSSLNILRRETETGTADGWSKVAAKGAAPRRPVPQATAASGGNRWAALSGSKVTFSTKKKEKVPKKPVMDVVDDWEAEMAAEEARESGARDSQAEAEADASSAAHTEDETSRRGSLEENQEVAGEASAQGAVAAATGAVEPPKAGAEAEVGSQEAIAAQAEQEDGHQVETEQIA
ncbi:FKBP12-associated protein [Taxawa tesnikishii (nom. ined.)]|nr:FKBP12-associated protein [Dothideales sp. JES 119]